MFYIFITIRRENKKTRGPGWRPATHGVRERSRRPANVDFSGSCQQFYAQPGDFAEGGIAGQKWCAVAKLQAAGGLQRIRGAQAMPDANRGGQFDDDLPQFYPDQVGACEEAVFCSVSVPVDDSMVLQTLPAF